MATVPQDFSALDTDKVVSSRWHCDPCAPLVLQMNARTSDAGGEEPGKLPCHWNMHKFQYHKQGSCFVLWSTESELSQLAARLFRKAYLKGCGADGSPFYVITEPKFYDHCQGYGIAVSIIKQAEAVKRWSLMWHVCKTVHLGVWRKDSFVPLIIIIKN